MTDNYTTAMYGSSSADTAGGAGAVIAAMTVLTALRATMAGVGAGDNSANVATMATNLATLQTALNGAGVGANAAVSILVDLSRFPSASALRGILHQLTAGLVGQCAGP